MIKALFFDFDGTISDAREPVKEAIEYALLKSNYENNLKRIDKLMGLKLKEILRELNISKKLFKTIKRDYQKKLGGLLNKIKLCVSVKPLKEFKKKYILAVVSNNERKFILKSAKKLGIGGIFKEYYCSENFSTKDIALKKLFKKYNIKSNEAVYIGDRFTDVIYAKKAGCTSIAISNSYSWSSRKELLKEKPDFIIKDFYEIKRAINKINST